MINTQVLTLFLYRPPQSSVFLLHSALLIPQQVEIMVQTMSYTDTSDGGFSTITKMSNLLVVGLQALDHAGDAKVIVSLGTIQGTGK